MLSDKDKQAILNGAFGRTRDGRKAKFIGFNRSDNHVFEIETESGKYSDWKLYSFLKNFHLVNNSDQPEDIVGLWQDKPESFDLARALKGEPVLLRSGLKAFVVLDSITTAKKNFNKASVKSDGFPLLIMYCKEDDDILFTNWLTVDGLAWEDAEHNDIIGMWKEPEPQITVNNLQLPKPVTEPLPIYTEIYYLSVEDCKYVINRIFYKDIEFIRKLLENRMLYRTRAEVIQVIEAITGKTYEDR